MAHILVVEDETAVQRFINATLSSDHYVYAVGTVMAALDYLSTNAVDLLLLDLFLAGEDGMTVARYVRSSDDAVAVVILTGQGSLRSAIEAIDLGANSYLLKPVRPDELRHTVADQLEKANRRRQQESLVQAMTQAVDALRNGDGTGVSNRGRRLESRHLCLDRDRYSATVGGHDLGLSAAQFRVLWILVEANGTPVSPGMLVRQALGYSVNEAEAANLIKSYISQIRRKLAAYDAGYTPIRTIRGHGYLWVEEG